MAAMIGPVRGALLGEGPSAGKAFFFQGAQYWRYDLVKDYGEVDYPRPISDWGLPAEFATGIDACLPGFGLYTGLAFFFKDGWFVSYDWKTKKVGNRRPLSQWSKGSPFPFANGVDTALAGAAPHEGKVYFFKGAKYVRYDWKDDSIDLLDQDIARWNLGERFLSGIEACLNSSEGMPKRPITYFFKGADYVKYDWKADRGVEGYPLAIAAGWPTGCAVWAGHSQAPTLVCDDPRLGAGKNRFNAYPYGSIGGQAGWQVSTRFTDIEGLTNKLTALVIPEWYGDDEAGQALVPRGRITRLALNAHGMGGFFGANNANGMSMWPKGGVNEMNILDPSDPIRANFSKIGAMLEPGAPLLLLGCQVGQTQTGANLLIALSMLLKGHPVTGLTTIGYAGGGGSKRGPCSEAGMRDTNFLSPSRSPKEEDARVAKYWGDLKAWPWAFEASPNAKTMLNGELIHNPEMDSL